jgi:PAS domain S-box-containing protein
VTATQPSTAVVAGGDAPPAWAPPGAQLLLVDGRDVHYTLPASCDVALIDAASVDAVAAARRLRARQAALQLIVVVAPDMRQDLERALMFAPGIGEVWIEEPGGVDTALLRRAADVTRQRRSYQATREQLQQSLSALRPMARTTPQISDSYLAALLQVIPDPILSVDTDDCVLSWSPAAERCLPLSRGATAASLTELVQPADAVAFQRLLDRGRTTTVRAVIEWRNTEGAPRIAEMVVTPLTVGGHEVRAVVLRDTTEQQRAQDQLEEQASELELHAEQLAVQRDEIAAQHDELARLAEARSRFYTSMSHEIRTPINAILGYNDLLLAGVYGPLRQQQVHALQRAQAAARHLRELVNDVLDLSKIESGKIEIVAEEIDLEDIVREVVATIQPVARDNGVDLDLTIAGHATLTSDPRRVRQILLNLLSNAVKFGAGRPVHVRAGLRHPDLAFVEVRDHGPGIDAEQLERIFEEFVQLDSLAEGGTGLGLAISRRLATALGGRLDAYSRIGSGSRFSLLLPLGDRR